TPARWQSRGRCAHPSRRPQSSTRPSLDVTPSVSEGPVWTGGVQEAAEARRPHSRLSPLRFAQRRDDNNTHTHHARMSPQLDCCDRFNRMPIDIKLVIKDEPP